MFDGAAVAEAVSQVAESPVPDAGPKEVAFIDTSVADYQTLVDGLRACVEVVMLDAGESGLDQIARWAGTHTDYDAIHVLSHGAEGALSLGADTITGASLADAGVKADLAALGSALTEDGDLLLYGCSVASGEAGRDFLASLADATGADVAASDDATGSDGDWQLETSHGSIETAPIEVSSYAHSLVTRPTLDDTKSPALTTIHQDIGAPVNGSTANSTLVSALIDAGGSLGNFSDGDNPGIAVTGVNANGTLYYSTDNGANWTAAGALGQLNALVLKADSDTRVYFAPNADYIGTLSDAITFQAWDQTGGYSNGQTGVGAATATGLSLVGTRDTSGTAWGLAVSGSYAYVADYDAGLRVIDISDPASPFLVGTYNTSGSARGVAVIGTYAYVADYSAGLQVIDISNPASPSLIGTYNTSGYAWNVAVSGTYAYVADYAAGLQVIDISNPASPTLTGTYNTSGNACDVAVSGDYAYVADMVAGLQVIDISNPAHPTLSDTLSTTTSAYGVAVSGNYAYVAASQGGLKIINIANPANVSNTKTVLLTGGGSARDVTISGNFAYVTDLTSGLHMINISTPASASIRALYATSGTAYGVAISGNYAYVADGTSGLQVIGTSINNISVSTASDTVSLTVTARPVVSSDGGETATATAAAPSSPRPLPPPPSPPPAIDAGPMAPIVTVVRAAEPASFVFQPPPAAPAAPMGDGFKASSDSLGAVRPLAVMETAGKQVNFALPADTFAAIRAGSAVPLTATQMDGAALPSWLAFDPETGAFVGQPPPGLTGDVVVRVVARDQNGREVIVTVRINLAGENGARQDGGPVQAPAEGRGQKFGGKPTFQHQLHMASRLSGARQTELLAAARAVARNA